MMKAGAEVGIRLDDEIAGKRGELAVSEQNQSFDTGMGTKIYVGTPSPPPVWMSLSLFEKRERSGVRVPDFAVERCRAQMVQGCRRHRNRHGGPRRTNRRKGGQKQGWHESGTSVTGKRLLQFHSPHEIFAESGDKNRSTLSNPKIARPPRLP